MTIDQIVEKVLQSNLGTDISLLRLAYDFAEKAHEGQVRINNEPYIQHSLHTAFVLTQIKADLNTVIAGLLHDVPEDTKYTLADIEKNFGKDVSSLVEGVTKLGKIKYRGVKRYRENLKKMFLAMAQDIRIIMIKFSDRLHNLRTLEGLSNEKRQRIAKETLEIYAPIAELLGIWRLKWQMEDICFKYIYPEEYKKLQYKYETEKKTERNQFFQKIKIIVGDELRKSEIENRIEERFKHLYSIYEKMQKKNRDFDEIHDVLALRLIVTNVSDCYKTLGIIHSLWKPKPGRFKDYIATPKPNGYRSLHTTIFGPEGKSTEFQIRTEGMNDEALYGIAAHWHYKKFNKSENKQPKWVNEILEIQRKIKNTKSFIHDIKFDVFQNRIFVFSPKGDVFELPEGATPIDFAYLVHTDIGNKAIGVKINEQIATLEHELKDGDMVEIVVNKNRKGPNYSWVNSAKTKRAREKIKQYAKSSSLLSFKKFISSKFEGNRGKKKHKSK